MNRYTPGARIACPKCNTLVKLDRANPPLQDHLVTYHNSQVRLQISACPYCEQIVVAVEPTIKGETISHHLVWPSHTNRPPVPPEVPEHIAQDYNEAAAVLHLSPKASAALSRRCLQSVLREAGEVEGRNLNEEIGSAMEQTPDYIAKSLHMVREIGNFAAHPTKSTSSGEILDVEPDEAELNLDVLDDLFDFYYVKPARVSQRKATLNEKLKDANKRELK